MYQLSHPDLITGQTCSVIKLETLTAIPFDPANTDYQAFLRWCEEGNTPLPADEPPAK